MKDYNSHIKLTYCISLGFMLVCFIFVVFLGSLVILLVEQFTRKYCTCYLWEDGVQDFKVIYSAFSAFSTLPLQYNHDFKVCSMI